MIKTYRGLLADGGQDKIRLRTNKGEVGYRIHKFQIIPKNAGTADLEGAMKIFKLKQTSIVGGFNFTDGDLLAGAFFSIRDNAYFNEIILFDREIFNQDIYITYFDSSTGEAMNYYLELEQVKLTDNQTTMATLQSLRQLAEK